MSFMSANSLRVQLRALPRSVKRGITIAIDVSSVAAALLVTVLVQNDASGSLLQGWGDFFVLALLVAVPVFLTFGLYQNVIRYMGSGMLFTVLSSVTVATVLFWIVLKLSGNQVCRWQH